MPEAEVYLIAANHSQHDGPLGDLMRGFRAEHDDDFYSLATHTGMTFLATAITRAGSTEPVSVASLLPGMRAEGFDGPQAMRADDHQLQTGLWVSRWQSVGEPGVSGLAKTGYGFAPVAFLPAEQVSRPTTCRLLNP